MTFATRLMLQPANKHRKQCKKYNQIFKGFFAELCHKITTLATPITNFTRKLHATNNSTTK